MKFSLKGRFEGFYFFYKYIGNQIFFMLALSLFVGFLDGLGLSMFLPLLQVVEKGGVVAANDSGNLNMLVTAIQNAGFRLTVVTVLIFIAVFFVLKGVFVFIQFYYRVYLQEYFIKKIRMECIQGLNQMAYKAFVETDSGRIQNTLVGEVDRVSKAYQSYFSTMQGLIMVIIYLGFAFFVNAEFALLVSAGGALTNIVYRQIYKNTKGASRKLTSETNLFQGLILQHIHNYKYLKATGSLSRYGVKLEGSINKIQHNNKYIGVLMSTLNASREPLVIGVVVVVIYIQTVILGSSLGPILISLLFFYRALSFLMQMQSHQNYYLSISGSLSNMEGFTKELAANTEQAGEKKFEAFKDKLLIQNGYLNYKSKPVLKNIEISIPKNKTIAFVGESGSGKTTLISILSGLMPLDSGHYSIDGIDRNELNITSFQNRIGYISQDPVIFNDTIFNNVTFWAEKNEKNLERFHVALKKAAAYQFVNGLEKKEDNLLGNNGINISGGQKQRISIARELYKDVDILILDEATSALDSETEREIQENLEHLKGEYTMLIVAHRLSTIKYADKIVLLKDGEIESIDTFAGLMEKSPVFSRMVKLQELQ